ncbi:MAG: hypothetical protein D3923_17835, partial [Candidatus Electrothrix sp. AR3]|nr:hypothetical protein [Candidatus Electrothrix sp. AR3]
CVFHLLLDPLQIKWANGTLFAAPFSWQVTNFAWFWPEELPSLLLTLLGLLFFPLAVWFDRQQKMYCIKSTKRQIGGLLLLFLYLLVPLALFNGPLEADSHFAATLKKKDRTACLIEVDRRPFRGAEQSIFSYSDEQLRLKGILPEEDGIISLQGVFVDNTTIFVSAYHRHTGLRDLASKVGIFFLCLSWLVALCGKRIRIARIQSTPNN